MTNPTTSCVCSACGAEGKVELYDSVGRSGTPVHAHRRWLCRLCAATSWHEESVRDDLTRRLGAAIGVATNLILNALEKDET